MNEITKCLQHYADFNGRASRKEYWMFWLFCFVLGLITGLINDYLSYVASIALLLPSLAVGVRRLHDVGKSGWMLLIGLIPIIGTIWLLVLYCTPSVPATNQWGDCPSE